MMGIQNIASCPDQFLVVNDSNIAKSCLDQSEVMAHRFSPSEQRYTFKVLKTFEKRYLAKPFGQSKMGWFLAD